MSRLQFYTNKKENAFVTKFFRINMNREMIFNNIQPVKTLYAMYGFLLTSGLIAVNYGFAKPP